MKKALRINGLVYDGTHAKKVKLEVFVSNDEKGKTLSINNGQIMFSIPFAPIEQYLK